MSMQNFDLERVDRLAGFLLDGAVGTVAYDYDLDVSAESSFFPETGAARIVIDFTPADER